MRNQFLVFGLLFLFIPSLIKLQAQDVIPASGSSASGSGGSATYTVGQLFYQIYVHPNSSVSEGVQQPYEISVITSIDEMEKINLYISTYPNPVTNYLNLSVEYFSISDLSFRLYDLQGKSHISRKITDNETKVVLNQLPPSIYFLKVLQKNREVKTFKIIKK